MRRRSLLLPAVVAVATGWLPVLAATPAEAAADPLEPLSVSIERLTPGQVPAKGRIRVTGTVTNLSEERWRAINVYAFIGDRPMTSSAELAATASTPFDAYVGRRIVDPGTFDKLGSLAPGESAPFSLSLKRSELPVSEAGVYWFGAHALGNTTEARDLSADGRARTLLPLVPRATRGTERAALVLPIRHPIRHTRDGRLRAARRWADDLAPRGRLRSLVDFGAAADVPLTWLVDPAVPDAVAQLVAGNPSRSLDETTDNDTEDAAEGSASSGTASDSGDGESGSPSDGASVDPEAPEVAPGIAAAAGATWLSRLESALAGDDVLTLPYGNLDVAAAAAHAPELYARAVRRGSTQLDRWKVRTRPAVAPPEGYLPAASLSLLEGTEPSRRQETVILSDATLPEGQVRATARVDGTPVLFSSAAVALGGPGPGQALSEISLRQRFLAEAAVRLLFHERTPLLTVFPSDFTPDSTLTFWDGLDDVEWLELTDPDGLSDPRRHRRSDSLDPALLDYPIEQELTELDPENFSAAQQLIDAGRTLDTVLPNNDTIGARVVDEALTSLSYSERDRALESRRSTLAAKEWIDRRLHRVRLRAPRGVTLSSDAGSIATTISNRLDHPVRVMLSTVSLGDVEVDDSEPVELAPGARQTVLLDAVTGSPGVHYVRVMVTDETGTPLGAAQRVAIRSAEVSQVIWVILGVGVGLLFVAIATRVVRRVRRERS